jgi:hypothetical protein
MTGGWAHIEQVCTGAVVTLLPHIWPRSHPTQALKGTVGVPHSESGVVPMSSLLGVGQVGFWGVGKGGTIG